MHILLLNGDEYMKQVIPFVKDLNFQTKLSEITSIALEHNLQMENDDSIVGNFLISGKYKINDISINEEVFEQEVPFDITLDDKYDTSKVQIDIDDFYYEIINDEFLRIHIDVLANNLVYVKQEEETLRKEEVEPEVLTISNQTENKNDEDGIVIMTDEPKREEINIQNITEAETKEERCIVPEEKEEIANVPMAENVNIANSLSTSFLSETEKYITYKVHIVRENETIEEIKTKYNVTTEELEKYNTLDNIVLGTKIVVPLSNEE